MLFDLFLMFLDKEVGKIFTQISVTKGEAYIKLDEQDFYEKKMINKRKKWILEGLDPDEEEQKYLKRIKKSKRIKKKDKNERKFDKKENNEDNKSETEDPKEKIINNESDAKEAN